MKIHQTHYEHCVTQLQQQFPLNSALNVGIVFQLNFEPNPEKLNKAIAAMHAHMGNLRAYFDEQYKYINSVTNCPAPNFITENIRIEDHEHTQKLSTIQAIQANFLTLKQQPFNLDQAPLYRIKIVCVNQQDYYFMIVASHAITDGYGIWLYIKRLFSYYQQDKKHLHCDLAAIEHFAAKYPVLPQNSQHRPILFSEIDHSSNPSSHTPYYAANVQPVLINFEHYPKLLTLAQQSASQQNALLLTILQRALFSCLNDKAQGKLTEQLAIKHSTLNRDDRQSLTYFGCIADAALQVIDKNQADVAHNHAYIQSLNDKTLQQLPYSLQAQQVPDLPIEICYGNFSTMYTSERHLSTVTKLIPQPTYPHMWADHVKLKINAHQSQNTAQLILMGLAQYISTDWLSELAEQINQQATMLNNEH